MTLPAQLWCYHALPWYYRAFPGWKFGQCSITYSRNCQRAGFRSVFTSSERALHICHVPWPLDEQGGDGPLGAGCARGAGGRGEPGTYPGCSSGHDLDASSPLVLGLFLYDVQAEWRPEQDDVGGSHLESRLSRCGFGACSAAGFAGAGCCRTRRVPRLKLLETPKITTGGQQTVTIWINGAYSLPPVSSCGPAAS